MRCLSLLEILKSDFDCVFMIQSPSDHLIDLLNKYSNVIPLLDFKDQDNEIETLQKLVSNQDILVIDGYTFDSVYQKRMKALVNKLVTIDDEAAIHIYADLVINHGNPTIKKSYDTEPYTRLLLGPQYLLAQKAYLESAKLERSISKIDTIFICMGGGDPMNITCKVLNATLLCDFIKKIYVVTGSAYKYQSELREVIDRASINYINWEVNLDPNQIIELINRSQIAIATSSSISLEICCVKSGLLTGMVAANQKQIHDLLISKDCAISVVDFIKCSEEEIVQLINNLNDLDVIGKMMQQQKKLIDGDSNNRLLNEFKKLSNC